MPADYQTIASAIISLANNPNTVLTFARTTGATDFTRQMARGRRLRVLKCITPISLPFARAAANSDDSGAARYRRLAFDGQRCHWT
ncbi:hypothetical protein F6P93_15985 [Escherichia coli]|nr:hypothetical protein F6P93_15985 [Escherichia coli]